MNEKILNVVFDECDYAMIKFSLLNYLKANTDNQNSLNIGEFSCVSLDLNICDIKNDFYRGRVEAFSMLYEPYKIDKHETEEIVNQRLKEFENILQKAREGYKLRMWTSNSVCAKCGFYYLVYQLKDIDVEIEEYHTDLKFFSDLDRIKLTIQKPNIKEICDMWEKLLENDTGLRILKYGKVINVPIDYYDDLIRKTMPKKKISVDRLCGYVLARIKGFIQPYFISDRIRKLYKK